MPRAFHPPLIAAFPVLALYRSNIAFFPLSDLWRPLAIAVGAALLVWLLAAAAFRDWRRGAIASSLIALWAAGYGHVERVFARLVPGHAEAQVQAEFFRIWMAVAVVVLALALWSPKRVPLLTRGFNAGALILLLTVVAGIAWGTVTLRRDAAGVRVPGNVADASVRASGRLPDVFYIVLDGHGSTKALKEGPKYDDSAFIAALEARGFYVARDSRPNYCQTELSIASSLNMEPIETLLPKIDRRTMDRYPLDRLVDRSAVAARLRRVGYGYVAVATGFPGFSFSSADRVAEYKGGLSLLESTLLEDLPLPARSGVIGSQFETRRDVLLNAFRTLKGLGRPSTRPRFVVAHILAPHPPFVFNPDGSQAPKPHVPFGYWDGSDFRQFEKDPEVYRKGYTDQIQYIDKATLETVDAILSQEATPPIIVIQGDHGSKLNYDQESLEKTDLRECFGILNAYYVPKSVSESLYPGITPVNTFRTLFRVLFGDNLPILPDRSEYSTWSHPYVFTDVTARVKDR